MAKIGPKTHYSLQDLKKANGQTYFISGKRKAKKADLAFFRGQMATLLQNKKSVQIVGLLRRPLSYSYFSMREKMKNLFLSFFSYRTYTITSK